MIAGSKHGVAVSLLILSALGIPMRAQAGDPGTALVVQIRPADSPPSDSGIKLIRATAESRFSTPSTQSAIPECDGEARAAGSLTTFMNRVMGRKRLEDVRLCAVPPDRQSRRSLQTAPHEDEPGLLKPRLTDEITQQEESSSEDFKEAR